MTNFKDLTLEEERVIVYKGTEAPFTGEYEDFYVDGTYVCRRCAAPLYTSDSKFHSGCGWPSFDQEIAVFGGGCFWCTEAVFSMLKGVVSVKPGYAGGDSMYTDYESVCADFVGVRSCGKT